MPQDPHLYGQRPAKKQKKEIPLSSSLAFTSQLTSLLSASSSTSASSGRARPSRQKDDIFSAKSKRKTPPKHHQDEEDATTTAPSASEQPLKLKNPHGTEEEMQDFRRARRNMEEKARLYAAMKRGDYLAKDNEASPLVDFDRKWAESHPDDADGDPNRGDSSSGSDNESLASEVGVAGGGELIEYKDEFGRTRTGTRGEVRRRQRRQARSRLGAAELEAMSARPAPAAPDVVIHGDVIQSEAFNPETRDAARMADLAARRDRTPTPPPDAHFDGRAEIRTKGVGFYQFSAAEEDRRREMEALRAERESTERARRERESERERRRREIEERRRRIGRARVEKLADSFLDGLAGELGTGGGGGGGDDDGKRERSDEGAQSDVEKAGLLGSAETTAQKGYQ
ncbi:hypothetical protein DL764_007420 [Monosporascus ibericus]|uniref:Uncharacterized protein n=1 Tax=Monosporascus ibericus TaxID=155417 RepID=A0A4Q4T3J6_9PEZI|nr:hypothetical protein DL764_007420 [Monosporascus ibericus]